MILLSAVSKYLLILSVSDPFDLSHNLGAGLTRKSKFVFVYTLYLKNKSKFSEILNIGCFPSKIQTKIFII